MSQFWVNASGSTPPEVATTYIADVGSATPALNILNVLGGTNASTSASGNTIIINATPGAPNQVISDFDDFTSEITKLGFQVDNVTDMPGTATNPGLVIPTGTTVSYDVGLFGNTSTAIGPFAFGGGTFSQNWVHNLVGLSDDTNSYTIYIGLVDGQSFDIVTDPISGIYFKYTHTLNSGNWQIVCNDSGAITTANTSTPASTAFHNYGIQINATATSVAFTIDGVVVSNSPITTNIPLTALGPAVVVLLNSGNIPLHETDLYYYTQILTVAR